MIYEGLTRDMHLAVTKCHTIHWQHSCHTIISAFILAFHSKSKLSTVLIDDEHKMNVLLCGRRCTQRPPNPSLFLNLARFISNSPYGRTHVWRRRPPKLPNPVVPHFPQRVILADGSTFIQWTTSPRSTIKLTRDTTNNPLWNPWLESSNPEDAEGASAGRLGRFRRKFEELGGTELEMDWVEGAGVDQKAPPPMP